MIQGMEESSITLGLDDAVQIDLVVGCVAVPPYILMNINEHC